MGTCFLNLSFHTSSFEAHILFMIEFHIKINLKFKFEKKHIRHKASYVDVFCWDFAYDSFF